MATMHTGYTTLSDRSFGGQRNLLRHLQSTVATRSDQDTRGLLAAGLRLAVMLALGGFAVLAVSGQFPWFLVPLGMFLCLTSCMPWREADRKINRF